MHNILNYAINSNYILSYVILLGSFRLQVFTARSGKNLFLVEPASAGAEGFQVSRD
jgi:hypothetical protein